MNTFDDAADLLWPERLTEEQAQVMLELASFKSWKPARERLLGLCANESSRKKLEPCLPILLLSLSEAATPDGSLINFERYVQSVPDREELFSFLSSNPRAVEILIKLFVGSQFLTEILLRNPSYLQKLTRHKRLADFKNRQQFLQEAEEQASLERTLAEKFNSLRRFQHWELLRIGACDAFNLMDLKSITLQLSLLADSMVQACLNFLANEMNIDPTGFVVLAFGKLGGEELNYSSDIDLVFLSDTDATRFWGLGQRLIKALMEPTAEGFMYRVDMRLRPWGQSGSLVNTVDAHIKYLQQHGMLWEKQALLKARPIAGTGEVGQAFLERVQPLIFNSTEEEIRENVKQMKSRIEAELKKQGRDWGEVKSGKGSIRDVEFVTQYLQLRYGGEQIYVRSINTLDALMRLAEFGWVQADEYRQLSSGYLFLRTVEHSLQLMHHKQTHSLPTDERELAWFARRLDFPNSEVFLTHYEQHRCTIREIYNKYILQEGVRTEEVQVSPRQQLEEMFRSEPGYAQTFTQEERDRQAELLARLNEDCLVTIDAQRIADLDLTVDDSTMVPLLPNDSWRLTIAGYDYTGDLSLICGLLFCYGFNIISGEAFTGDGVPQQTRRRDHSGKQFIDVFLIRCAHTITDDLWHDYQNDLASLMKKMQQGQRREAQGELAKRVAEKLESIPELKSELYPVQIELDNEASERFTVLEIRGDDTVGFLYELANALSLASIDVGRVSVATLGTQVSDILYVTNPKGEKITDPREQQELRTAVVLIKQFTHLLPRSPNPEGALLHFREFLEGLFQRENWSEELASLQKQDVLAALAQLLGVSDFLWDDFLRLQHDNLFPVVTDQESLDEPKTKAQLEEELQQELQTATTPEEKRDSLNAFKDREMFRIDMRHILGRIEKFGPFSAELTDVAEVVVAAGCQLIEDRLQERHGVPRLENDAPCHLTVCALGKCGGRELGFASDIELLFLYTGTGRTDGAEPITNGEYYVKLVDGFRKIIEARREGIFQLDLRLRPYGKAGALAVTLDTFHEYFASTGAAWPYERQALVKLRPIAGDAAQSEIVTRMRDELIYRGEPFDVTAMRAMREKQVRQLVQAGTFNAKLSPGGLVDCEYLVQGLQLTHAHNNPALRETNTRHAMTALHAASILNDADHVTLRAAHIFLRKLIDALRMVRGHAKDLTVPDTNTEGFEFLARRLGYSQDAAQLAADLETHTQNVRELNALLDLT